MDIEYEATFKNINKEEIKERLKQAGATLVKSEILMKRVTFSFPEGHAIKGGWIRVRDEGDKITTSIKIVDGDKIEDQKEICLIVDNFKEAVKYLTTLGCEQKAHHETKREMWKLDGVEICIDEWPFLEPFVEVEGPSEEMVKEVSKKIGFDYNEALFCEVCSLYEKKYGVSVKTVANETPEILFNIKNPFLKS